MQLYLIDSKVPTNIGLQPNKVLKYLHTSSINELGIGKFKYIIIIDDSKINIDDLVFDTITNNTSKYNKDTKYQGKIFKVIASNSKELTINTINAIDINYIVEYFNMNNKLPEGDIYKINGDILVANKKLDFCEPMIQKILLDNEVLIIWDEFITIKSINKCK